MSTRRLHKTNFKILDEPGRYQSLALIGHGSTGSVYKDLHTKLGKREIVIETLPDSPTEEDLSRFRRQMESLARLEHDKIACVCNIGEYEQGGIVKPYLTMPFLEGESLEHVIAKAKRVPVEQCVNIVLQVCEALQAVHLNGIIHGDIKPSNIFVPSTDQVKLVDFGLARMLNVKASRRRTGTFRHMAPKQIQGTDLDKRSDLFSVGVVFYELLANGHPPLPDSDTVDQMNIDVVRLEHLKNMNPEVDDSLCRIIHKALQKDPGLRYQAAEEMGSDLEKLLDKKMDSHPKNEAPSEIVKEIHLL